MFEFINTYQWIFWILVLINLILISYVIGPRLFEDEISHLTSKNKFLLYLCGALSIIGFLFGIYLCITWFPTFGEVQTSSIFKTIKGNIFRILIPIFILLFNGLFAIMSPFYLYLFRNKK